VVRWINEHTAVGRTIGSAIPPGFDAYATVVLPESTYEYAAQDRSLVETLSQHSTSPDWWLGSLETGGDMLPGSETARVKVYRGWQYLLLKGGPEEALTWRTPDKSNGRTLPDLIFPKDQTWLVSTLWDDDWRCVGGSTALVDALRTRVRVEARTVAFNEDMTPPGHTMY
jgi:hypothetical protein